MKNLDVLQHQKIDIMNKFAEAAKSGNEEELVHAFTEWTDMVQEAVMAEAKGMIQANDNAILAGRGVRVLTSEERQYYERLIDAMKSDNPKQALIGFGDVLPKTVIDAIFEDITETHPLLSAIQFKNAEALVEYLYSNMDGRFKAIWGKLCDEITHELAAQFHKIDFGQNKLSAFIPVCKAMLDLGPAWLDRYVRTILFEAIANGLEDGVINGRGTAEGDPQAPIYEPIGMIKDLSNYNLNTGYADKVAIPVANFSPESYGGLIAQLAVGPNGLNRAVNEVLLICNPVDYYTKVMPATMYRQPDGTWISRFPYPTRIVQSAWVDQGQAIIGIANRYFAVLGTGKDGRILYSDEYRFLEDERVYLIKLYGTGRPLDNNSFLLLDISGLKPVHPVVRVADYVDARLDGIAIKNEKNANVNLGLFDENIHYYEGAIADASVSGDNDKATLTVTPNDSNAQIVVEANGSAVSAGAGGAYEITLSAGQNVIIITSSIEGVTEAYVVVITYTPIS